MKAITIRQPWTWLIVNGYKDIENRTWRTKFRGHILIHAASSCTRKEYEACKNFVNNIDPKIIIPPHKDLELRGVVGEAEVTDCVDAHASPWFEGPFGFTLSKVRKLPFKEVNGNLGIFHIWD